jgi:hypothetical protein
MKRRQAAAVRNETTRACGGMSQKRSRLRHRSTPDPGATSSEPCNDDLSPDVIAISYWLRSPVHLSATTPSLAGRRGFTIVARPHDSAALAALCFEQADGAVRDRHAGACGNITLLLRLEMVETPIQSAAFYRPRNWAKMHQLEIAGMSELPPMIVDSSLLRSGDVRWRSSSPTCRRIRLCSRRRLDKRLNDFDAT